MSDDSARRSFRRIYTTLVVLAVVYPLSFFPTCWTLMRLNMAKHQQAAYVARRVYAPLVTVYACSPQPVRTGVRGLLDLGAPPGVNVMPKDEGIVWTTGSYAFTLHWVHVRP